MPVEIRELIIRAVTRLKDDDDEEVSSDKASSLDREEIIQECVRQVLRILQKSKER